MSETIKLTLDEIRSEKLDLVKQFKVFVTSIVLIPIAMLSHITVTLWGIFVIPNAVIDIVSLAEKRKQLTLRKCNA